ncbi:tRNA pseudouridine(38-40) synthase TruA [Trichlorobacter ammonificans]|uniref:tRNA pseudouridine synthase A n=1 Tax=Trichlorobacter ammonificans TaxID=2916410 RepID=A0ABM9DAL2_9BACT|nr:tRNA pseudouridine(38-40) synthase TruA [Trichlorobacter ammonificans]CAH2032278.1 tRNA pseudouridine synthase A [Trichlorobacter ammonificans]
MRTIKLILQYDGTNYCGWQEQANGPSVQETVELALAKILGQRMRVQAAGRTDAGVHALAMPAVFRTESTLPLTAFVAGVNSHLPEDIAVQGAEEVPVDFRVIGGASDKTYRYTIYNARLRSPLHRRTSWHVPVPLDVDAMCLAAEYFVGEHDFAAFRGQNCTAVTSRRRIDAVTVTHEQPLITIDVTGGGFLKHMVRIMVGTLVDIGRRRFAPDHIALLLARPDRRLGGVTAPPQGLCLLKVRYPGENHSEY